MVFVSLFIEVLRTRPLVLFWGMAGLQVAAWTLVPLLFYSAPPGQLPLVLAAGHELPLVPEFGPPLAFLLAELAFRAAGLLGVYLLSQICVAIAYWGVLSLGRSIVGDSHAVLAVLAMAGIASFSVPTAEFRPDILAAALWALCLACYWHTIRDGRWMHWIGLGASAGLLVLTVGSGLMLVGLLALFTLFSSFARARIMATVGPWVAGLVAMATIFPYLIWIDRTGVSFSLPDAAAVAQNLSGWGRLVGILLAGHAGLIILVVLVHGVFASARVSAPEILRTKIEGEPRAFVYFFSVAPLVAIGAYALVGRLPDNFIGTPLVLLSGLAIVLVAGEQIRIAHQYLIGYAWAALMVLPPLLVALAIVFQPWIFAIDLRVGWPAAEIGRFFGDTFERRTGRPLRIVAGEPSLAMLVSVMAPSRPRLYLDPAPASLPRVTRQEIEQDGAVVVWRAADASGQPPVDIARQFPNLTPEVPRSFERRFQGRMPLLRVGFAVIRPRQPPASEPAAGAQSTERQQ